jgi:hypothetical protein
MACKISKQEEKLDASQKNSQGRQDKTEMWLSTELSQATKSEKM